MRETVILIWTLLSLVFSFLLMYVMKRQKRGLGKYVMIYKLILILVTFIVSYLVYSLVRSPLHSIWSTRLAILLLGTLNVWVLYKRPWTVRSTGNYAEDAFFPEALFVLISGCLVSITFVTVPQLFEIIEYRIDVSRDLWESPLIFWLPFLFLKLTDFSGQIPFKTIENPWVYPTEPIHAADFPWRELMQVNFHLKKSLVDEYNVFSWSARPWIEAPKEIPLGKIFQLCIQERRKRDDLSTIQDLGDEYDGAREFCWLFSIKRVWYNPLTWFRTKRYLNPDLNIHQNKVKKSDIISAKRIPGDGTKLSINQYDGQYGDDEGKTVLINR